jgi:hypothetical protein
MYEVDYGPLHDFSIFNVVAILMFWMKINDSNSRASRMPMKLFALLLLGLFLVLAALDGRRAMSIFALTAMLLYYIALPSSIMRWVSVFLIGLAGLFAYVSAAVIRSGQELSAGFDNIYAPLATVGTEYRDFIYGFSTFTRSKVLSTGYDWAGSTAAVLTPSFLANAFGIDKNALITHDSARSLMPLWNVQLGIRIGLPGELWFAYGWLAVAQYFAFGVMVMLLASWAGRSEHFAYKAILLALLAVFTLSMQGQSTVTFGFVLPLLYLTAAIALIELLSRKFLAATYNR